MALVTTPKAASAVSNMPSRVVERPTMSINQPSASSARAQALKARLASQPAQQPIANRPVGSSARAAEFSKLNKFTTPAPKPPPAIQSRQSAQDLSSVEPPPSGAVAESATPSPSSAESVTPSVEATNATPSNPQFDILARKERQLRKAQQEFKASQEAWKQEQAKFLSRDTLVSDPLKVLAEAGITADKLVELQINQAASKDPQQILLDKIAALEAKITNLTDPEKGELAKRDQQAYEAALTQIDADVRLLVESNPVYGTVKSEGKASEVKDLIVKVFEAEGTILDVEEACQLVEDKLVENLVKDYQRISKLEKIKAKIGKPAESAEAVPVQQPISGVKTSQQQKQTTLTNSGAASRPMSARDRAVLAVQARMDALRNK